MTQEHALRLEETFNEMFPQYPNMTRVITHKSEHKGKLINQFKHEEYPRIAITACSAGNHIGDTTALLAPVLSVLPGQ